MSSTMLNTVVVDGSMKKGEALQALYEKLTQSESIHIVFCDGELWFSGRVECRMKAGEQMVIQSFDSGFSYTLYHDRVVSVTCESLAFAKGTTSFAIQDSKIGKVSILIDH